MFGTVIDNEGYKVEFVILNEAENKVPLFYKLKDGESVIEKDWGIANTMNKPRWTGEGWVDKDPLPPVIPQEPELTEIEILQEQMLDSYLAQAELYEVTLNQEEQILDSYLAQAELFEVILAQEETINELKNRLDALEGIAQPLI